MLKYQLMKKSTAVLVFLLATAGTNAQVKWGVNAGITSTSNYEKDGPANGRFYSSRQGFTAGGALAVRLFKGTWSETGVSFYQKSYHYRSALMPDFSVSTLFKLNYITLNQNILVKAIRINNLSLSTGAGFFAAVPVSGRYVSDLSFFSGFRHEEGNIKFGDAEGNDFKAIDAGMNVIVRSQYKNVQLTMQYSPSFIGHVPGTNTNSNFKEKLRCLSFTLGYEF
jgi:hypothetical protein